MKNKILLLAVIVICFTIATSGTLAYFTFENKAHSVVTTGEVETSAIGKLNNGSSSVEHNAIITGVMPDDYVAKEVIVTNTGKTSTWLRVKVSRSVLDKDNNPLPTKIADTYEVADILFNQSDWIYDSATGYYYYEKAVEPGESTEELFSGIHFAKEMGNEYQDSTIKVTVLIEAVQSDYNSIPDGGDVTDTKGWPDTN